ncbi:MAG TPA: AraC family transcriptional regulator [Candidatus Polarisedimenticolia bacterium]|nr:AraC family transcriptional regulator [Candidatus Polarisedimenticolia bacterium]
MADGVAGIIEVAPRSDADGLVFYRGTAVTHPYPPHWHDELHLCAYDAGTGFVGWYGRSDRVVPGDLLLTPPGVVHSNWVEAGASVTFRSLYLPLAVLRAAAIPITGRAADAERFSGARPRDPELARAFRALHRGVEAEAPPLERDGLLFNLMQSLYATGPGGSRASRPPAAEPDGVRRAREYLHDHRDEPIGLADLSRVASLSPYHLHRAFRRATGLPPHAYLVRLRVNRARDLLRRGVAPAEVAHAAGFADQSHLTRHFRRLVGVTPARFRADA